MRLPGKPIKLMAQPSFVDTYMRARLQPVFETAPKGQVIIQEDDFADHAVLLIEGWMALSKMLPDGEIQIIDVMLPGDFALIGAVNAPVAACSVEALSAVRYVNIRPPYVNGPALELVKLRELMAGEIVRTQARTAELLLRLGKGSAASRVAYALLEFYVRLDAIGQATDACFNFPMTQQKIGEFTGLSNVHVCRTMRRFARDGIISHPGPSEIALSDLPALCEISGINLETLQHEILVQPRQ